MARPNRNASSENIARPARTFFATTKTSMGRRLLQSERNAELMVEVLRSLVSDRVFKLHDFVIMPDHLHLLLTVDGNMTIEKAMQMIKGRFSYQLHKEHGVLGEIWQRGFSEVNILNAVSFEQHRKYIAANPGKAGLIRDGEEYPYCFATLARKKAGRVYEYESSAQVLESRG